MGSKQYFRPFYGPQWAVPLDLLQLFSHLESYSESLESRTTLDLCHRFGKGRGKGIWSIPYEIKEIIAVQLLSLHYSKLNNGPSQWSDDTGQNRNSFFREKEIEVKRKVYSHSRVWQRLLQTEFGVSLRCLYVETPQVLGYHLGLSWLTVIAFLVPYYGNPSLDERPQPFLPAAIEQNDLELTDKNRRRFAQVFKRLTLTPFVHPTLLLALDMSHGEHILEQQLEGLDSEQFHEKIESLSAAAESSQWPKLFNLTSDFNIVQSVKVELKEGGWRYPCGGTISSRLWIRLYQQHACVDRRQGPYRSF